MSITATIPSSASTAFAVDRALKTMMDFEGPTRDALDLFKTALTIKREFLVPDD